MKKIFPLFIVVFLLGFAHTVKSQTTNEPKLATASKKTVKKKNVSVSNKVDKPVVATASKKTEVKADSKKASTPKKEGNNKPKLGVMNKKEK